MLVTSIWSQEVREMEAAGPTAPALRKQEMINAGQIAQKKLSRRNNFNKPTIVPYSLLEIQPMPPVGA